MRELWYDPAVYPDAPYVVVTTGTWQDPRVWDLDAYARAATCRLVSMHSVCRVARWHLAQVDPDTSAGAALTWTE